MEIKWKELYQEIKEIPIAEGIGTCVPLLHTSSGPTVLCPFHRDTRTGNFRMDQRRNRWKCFACGEGGDMVDFVSRFEGITSAQAALKIGRQYGLIQDDGARSPERRMLRTGQEKRPELTPQADPGRISQVYRSFVEAAPPLTEEHRFQLASVRDVHGWESDFFEWPARTGDFWRRFRARLGERMHLDLKSAVRGVPGFAYDTRRDQVICAPMQSGIGIILRDEAEVTGLQCRQDSGSPRYRLFSSGWASSLRPDGTNSVIGGASCHQVYDLVCPRDGVPLVGAAITEGHFKGIQLAKLGYRTLCLTGVCNTRGVVQRFTQTLLADGVERISIFYDQDSFHKAGVARAALALGEQLLQDFQVLYGVWDESCGKGVDDVILNGYRDTIRVLPFLDVKERLKAVAG